MSEDKDKKTETPSHRKLKEAREKGQVPRSKEVVSAIVLLVATVYFYLFWGDLLQYLKTMIVTPAHLYDTNFDSAKILISGTLLTIALKFIVLPLLAVLLLVTILANVGQFGIVFSTDPVIPKAERISPASGFERIFSTKTLGDTSLSLVKIVLIGCVVWHVVYVALSSFPSYPEQCNLNCYLSVFQALMLKMMALLIPLFILLGILDYMLQKHEFIKQQKMTKDEAKRDFKNTEGDPFIKSSRKSLHHEMLYDDMEDRVKYSRIIITDYNKGVALSYSDEMELPAIVCKCSSGMLSKLLSIARQENVPIIENTTLTHALFEDGAIDEYIPQSTIKAVAALMK